MKKRKKREKKRSSLGGEGRIKGKGTYRGIIIVIEQSKKSKHNIKNEQDNEMLIFFMFG